MRAKARLFGIVLCVLCAAACGEDGGKGTTVSGTVFSWEETEGITVAGVTVGVFGEQTTTTTDANGKFTLQNVPDGNVFFTTMVDNHWGLVDYYLVPQETEGRDVWLNVIPDAEVARWERELGRSISASDGAVDLLYYDGAEGGETGAIAPPAGDAPFTFDLWTPVDQASVIVDRWMCDGSICTFGELLFPSVDPANGPITATVTGVPGTTTCHIDETPGTEYPIIAKSLTIVYAWCEPAQ